MACTVVACRALVGLRTYMGHVYIYNSAQCSDCVWLVQDVAFLCRILHDTLRYHDDIRCRTCQVFKDEVHHLAKRRIFVLEELRDTEEKVCSFVRWKCLPSEYEQGNLGKEYPTLPGRYRRVVKQASWSLVSVKRYGHKSDYGAYPLGRQLSCRP